MAPVITALIACLCWLLHQEAVASSVLEIHPSAPTPIRGEFEFALQDPSIQGPQDLLRRDDIHWLAPTQGDAFGDTAGPPNWIRFRFEGNPQEPTYLVIDTPFMHDRVRAYHQLGSTLEPLVPVSRLATTAFALPAGSGPQSIYLEWRPKMQRIRFAGWLHRSLSLHGSFQRLFFYNFLAIGFFIGMATCSCFAYAYFRRKRFLINAAYLLVLSYYLPSVTGINPLGLSDWHFFSTLGLLVVLSNILTTLLYPNINQSLKRFVQGTGYAALGLALLWNFFGDKSSVAVISIIVLGLAPSIGLSMWQSLQGNAIGRLMTLGQIAVMLAVIGGTLLQTYFSLAFSYSFAAIFIGFATEVICYMMATTLSVQSVIREDSEVHEHALDQLKKLLYQDQIVKISQGAQLESTMLNTPGRAAVLVFDIAGSSKVHHEAKDEIFRAFFAACYESMGQGSAESSKPPRAYRAQELGDGFICSVAYPFPAEGSSPCLSALQLGREFLDLFAQHLAALGETQKPGCGLSVVYADVTGHFPTSGLVHYKVEGRAITLGLAYEALRKPILTHLKSNSSILILSELVWLSLPKSEQQSFTAMDLGLLSEVDQSDYESKTAYYQLIDVDVSTRRSA